MASPQLVAQSDRTISEADVRALALAKVRAKKAYYVVLDAPTKDMTEDQLVDRELELTRVRKEMFAADAAFDKAV